MFNIWIKLLEILYLIMLYASIDLELSLKASIIISVQ